MLVNCMFTVSFITVFIVCNMGPILNKTDMSRDSVFCHCDNWGGVTVIFGGGGYCTENVSQWTKKFMCLKKPALRFIYIIASLLIYITALDRDLWFLAISIILQCVSAFESPPKMFLLSF